MIRILADIIEIIVLATSADALLAVVRTAQLGKWGAWIDFKWVTTFLQVLTKKLQCISTLTVPVKMALY